MTGDEAAWVRSHAWPRWMKRIDDEYRARKFQPGVGCFLYGTSPCELGVCPPCLGTAPGGHARCTTRNRIEDPFPWDRRIVQNWDLQVHGSRGMYHRIAVLLSACRGWVCPCGCWREAMLPSGQLGLFGAAA